MQSLALMFAIATTGAPAGQAAAPVVEPIIHKIAPPLQVGRPGTGRMIDDPDRKHRESIERQRLGPDGRRNSILGLAPELEPIEQSVADRGPLSGNARIAQMDTAASPIGFERLYRAPDDSGQLVRGSGGLYLTFPYSTYGKNKKGTTILVPPGAIFHIGMPRAWYAAPPAAPASESARPGQLVRRAEGEMSAAPDLRINSRIDLYQGPSERTLQPGSPLAAPTRRNVLQQQAPPIARPPSPTARTTTAESTALPPIASDENYRRAFFAALRTNRP
ncbi:MAG: hypothetical protein SGJ09_10340 [Phycisphaerae bacterium]|nr:hypothetical protein [Phycisphaerae bacterium]